MKREEAERLEKFEKLFEYLVNRKEEIPVELESLKIQGKRKSYHYKELFAEKLTVQAFLDMMHKFDIQ